MTKNDALAPAGTRPNARRRSALLAAGCALSLLMTGTVSSAQNASTGPAPAPARTTSLPVGICMNMGNTFESPTETAWGGRPIDQAQIDAIAAAGFNTIRLPVRWDTHASETAPYTIDPAYMSRVRAVVDAALTTGLNVILNSHHFEAMHVDPIANAPRHAAIWDQIGTTFAGYPREMLWFELENEPHNNFNHANLLAALAPALAAVRRTNPDRPVIIGGENWSGLDSLATLPMPDDPHVIPTFHYYDPFDFTHQGATWVNPSPALGRVYGTPADAERLQADVARVRAYIARTGLTPFMGETGAHTTVPIGQRIAYHTAVRETFAPTGIGMCMWGFANTFQFYDHATSAWIPGLRAAIGLPE